MKERYRVREGQEYVVGDALEVLAEFEGEASLIHLDDAWARPHRAGQFGVTYPTHDFDGTKNIIDACYTALQDGGWLIADADDWLLPKLITYLQQEWGNVAESYRGGGYRRTGGVTYLTQDGDPDRSGAGAYLTNGGYPVVFAHKGKTERVSATSARQVTTRQRESYGWGSVKPVEPYREWVNALYKPSGKMVIPCAGTAPAAVAAEQLHAEGELDEYIRYTCIDSEPEALEAFRTRRDAELE